LAGEIKPPRTQIILEALYAFKLNFTTGQRTIFGSACNFF
jgi:hypothetical protein